MTKEPVFLPSLLQVIWDQKPSEVSNVQTGLKPLMAREQVYTSLEAYFSWYRSNCVIFFFFF